jgi:long-chain fatty acid transport protein
MLRPPFLRAFARVSALVISVASLITAGNASAGGFESIDNGARSLGRAGAYVAGVEEPTAIYYNPAALTRIDGFGLTLNLNVSVLDVEFQRAPFQYNDGPATSSRSARELQFDSVSNSRRFFPAPMAFLSHDFGLDDWTFGFAVYGPPSHGAVSYPEMTRTPVGFDGDPCDAGFQPCRSNPTVSRNGGQAYTIIDQDILLFYPSLAVAYELEDIGLSFGLTAQLVVLLIDFRVAVDGSNSQDSDVERTSTEAEEFYSPSDFSARGFAGTGIFGVLWEPNDRFAIGASYRMRYNMVANGTIDIELPPLGGVDVGFAGDEPGELQSQTDATLRAKFPDVLRVGAQYTHRNEANDEVFDVELDLTYETWSRTESFLIDVEGEVVDTAGALGRNIPALELGRHFNDTVSVRLGSDLSMLRNPETGQGPVFRLGTYFESNGQPNEWTNLDFVPWMRVGATVGVSYHVGKFSIDAAYAYVWSPDRTVRNGEFDLLMPLWICEQPNEASAEACASQTREGSVHAVNNGEYSVGLQQFALGVTYGW